MSVAVRGRRKPTRSDARNVVRGQQTRAAILAAARTRILASGFEALRLDDLAHDAGVTKAAVVKSVGGKAAILLALNDEDRHTRHVVIREALSHRTGLRRRLQDVLRRLLELDCQRLNVVMACFGYMWFWHGADHDRAQAMTDETRGLLCELIVDCSAHKPGTPQLEIVSRRVLAAYVIAVRDVNYGRATLEQAVERALAHVLD
jgi:AcrR family transcriptional regulator